MAICRNGQQETHRALSLIGRAAGNCHRFFFSSAELQICPQGLERFLCLIILSFFPNPHLHIFLFQVAAPPFRSSQEGTPRFLPSARPLPGIRGITPRVLSFRYRSTSSEVRTVSSVRKRITTMAAAASAPMIPAVSPFFATSGPVSYTHLDVYKRQAYHRA